MLSLTLLMQDHADAAVDEEGFRELVLHLQQ
jgi:hypothetical protein